MLCRFIYSSFPKPQGTSLPKTSCATRLKQRLRVPTGRDAKVLADRIIH
jgi:hypothetical protein